MKSKTNSSNPPSSEIADKVQEALSASQKKLDLDGDGEIGKEDLAGLRAGKKKNETDSKDEDEDIEESSLDVLFTDETLSEEFKNKAKTIFQAVVSEKVNKIEKECTDKLYEAIEEHKNNLTEKIDDYLSYVVEEWYNENKIAIDAGLRTQIAENFMEGLRTLFVENYINIPEEAEEALVVANTQVETLTNEVNEEIQKNVEKTKYIASLQSKIAFSDSIEGLTVSEVEKLSTLSKDLVFENTEDFKKKIEILKETFLKTVVVTPKSLTETVVIANTTGISSVMEAYTKNLDRLLK